MSTPVISIIRDAKAHDVNLRGLKPLTARILKREKKGSCGVNVILARNRLLHSLNLKYRKKDKPTDVLSFSLNEPEFLGEINISIDKARKQALEYGVTLSEEIRRLLVHGLLHLLGHTHYRRNKRLLMEKKEKLYL